MACAFASPSGWLRRKPKSCSSVKRLGQATFPASSPWRLADTNGHALTFLADHAIDMIKADLTRDTQVRYLATGTGFLGSSYDYLKGVVDHLHEMDIPDPDLDALLAETEAEMARALAKTDGSLHGNACAGPPHDGAHPADRCACGRDAARGSRGNAVGRRDALPNGRCAGPVPYTCWRAKSRRWIPITGDSATAMRRWARVSSSARSRFSGVAR
jgi:hypothetical protein